MWNPFGPKRPATVPLDDQLRVLAECGIPLAAGVSLSVLTRGFGLAAFETDPYRLVLTAMGGEVETTDQGGPGGYLSEHIWHFDTECIEDHDAYAAIARRLRTLAQGDLPLENIEDYVDVEEGNAWVAFKLDGTTHRWVAEVQDD